MYGEPRLLLAGDSALVVEFGDEIGEELDRRVHALAYTLAKNPRPGLGAVSVMIRFEIVI